MGQKYAGWRKPESTGLVPGLSFVTSMLAVAALFLVMVLWFFLRAPGAAIVVLVVATVFIAPTMWRIKGTTAGDLLMAWIRTWPIRRKEAHIYETGLYSHLPGGRCAPPGYATPITLADAFDPDSGEDIVGALINLVQNTVTVVLHVRSHDQESLPEEIIDGRVAGWGNFLRIVCEHGDCAGLTVVSETTPETGAPHLVEIESRRSSHAPQLVQELVDEWSEELVTDTIRVTQRIAFTFRHSAGGFRDGVASVSRRLPELRVAATAAGLAADWASSAEIIAFTKAAFNPAAAPLIDEMLAREGDTGLRWSDAGPTYHDASPLRYYLHDSGKSMTYRCYEFPVQPVEDTVLAKVLRPNPRSPYKRVALVYRPHRPSDAKQMTDADFRDSYAGVQQTNRGLVDAGKSMRFDDLSATRDDLAEGHGLVDVGMLVTLTVGYDDTGSDAARALEDAGVTSSLAFSPCWTDQAVMFEAALGIGIYPDMKETTGGFDALGA